MLSLIQKHRNIGSMPCTSEKAYEFEDLREKAKPYLDTLLQAVGSPFIVEEDILQLCEQLDCMKNILLSISDGLSSFKSKLEQEKIRERSILEKKKLSYYPTVVRDATQDLLDQESWDKHIQTQTPIHVSHAIKVGHHVIESLKIISSHTSEFTANTLHKFDRKLRKKERSISEKLIPIVESPNVNSIAEVIHPVEEMVPELPTPVEVIPPVEETVPELPTPVEVIPPVEKTVPEPPTPVEVIPLIKSIETTQSPPKHRGNKSNLTRKEEMDILDKEMAKASIERNQLLTTKLKEHCSAIVGRSGKETSSNLYKDTMFTDGTFELFKQEYIQFQLKKPKHYIQLNATPLFKTGYFMDKLLSSHTSNEVEETAAAIVFGIISELENHLLAIRVIKKEALDIVYLFIKSATVRRYIGAYVVDDMVKKPYMYHEMWYRSWCTKHKSPKVLSILLGLIKQYLTTYQEAYNEVESKK